MTKRQTAQYVNVTVELRIWGKPEQVSGIVDDVLDNGTLQDAINELASDLGYDMEIKDAIVRTVTEGSKS